MDKPRVTIYTDGACSGNPGPGGWAAVIIRDGIVEEISGGEEQTTNQRMELRAALEALKCLAWPSRVELFSDSAYLVNAFRQDWFSRWQKNGWLNAARKQVANQILWQELLALSERHELTWHKLKGHSGHAYNDRCDKLARQVIDRLRRRPETGEIDGCP